jgi:hypothetical protein
MGRIVDGGREFSALQHRCGVNRPSLRGLKISTRIEGRKVDLELYSPIKVKATAADLALVQEHFGLNMSEALNVSLHLTANAIRNNKATPEV